MLCAVLASMFFFFFSSRRRHTRYWRDWSSDVCSSDLRSLYGGRGGLEHLGDLSVAERLSLGVFADVGFEQDAGSVQLTRGGATSRDEFVEVRQLLLGQSSTRYSFFIAALL